MVNPFYLSYDTFHSIGPRVVRIFNFLKDLKSFWDYMIKKTMRLSCKFWE